MIIIHAAQVDGSLTLWGEDSDPPPPCERPSGVHHPRCASASRLAKAMPAPIRAMTDALDHRPPTAPPHAFGGFGLSNRPGDSATAEFGGSV